MTQKESDSANRSSSAWWDSADGNIRVDMVAISATEYLKWVRHRSSTPATQAEIRTFTISRPALAQYNFKEHRHMHRSRYTALPTTVMLL
jgi:hypothetical protein